MVDGSLKCQKTEGSIHKVAAKMIGAESCNGWTYWHYQSGKNFKPIDELREKLRPRILRIVYKYFLSNYLKIFYFL